MPKNYIFLSIAIVIAAAILGFSITQAAAPKRSVLVRGLAQREVDANLAVWNVSYGLGGDELAALQKEISSKNAVIMDFLERHGLSKDDYSVLPAAITDTSLDMYSDKTRLAYRYLATSTLLVRTTKIKEVKAAFKDALELAKEQIALKQDYENKINYEFTGLNEIKPEMIAQATLSARAAAEQFAKDSNSEVGKIKNATQGLFSIENASAGLEDKKSVRVVTQIEYLLK